jgi:hypothetical protein
MDVFLIPVGVDRYELYCEVPVDELSASSPDHERAFFKGLVRRFRETLATLERERHTELAGHPTGILARVTFRVRRLIAEAIAEQRLLWHMRRQSTATAVHPSDLDQDRVMTIVRAQMQRDHDRHWLWLIVDGVLLVLSALLTLVPGPNLVAYYFAFRVVGHFLSIRGARQGLRGVTWTLASSEPLAELRTLASVPTATRRPRLDRIAAALDLQHLPRFFDRVAAPNA